MQYGALRRTVGIPGPHPAACCRERQIRHLAEQAPAGLAANVLLTFLLFAFIHPYIETVPLAIWVSLALAVVGYRALIVRRFDRQPPEGPLQDLWLRQFVTGALLSAAIWGAASVIFAPQLPPIPLLTTILVLAGLSAGAVSVLSVVFPLYVAYIGAIVLPLALWLLFAQEGPWLTAGLMTTLYLVLMLYAGYHHHRQMMDAFTLAFDKAALAESLQEQQGLVAEAEALARLGHWQLNLGSGELTWSDEVYRIFGIAPDTFDARYETFLAAVHPEDRNQVSQAFDASIRSGNDYEVLYRVLRRNGESRSVRERGKPYFDASRRPTRVIGTVQDITEQRQTEARMHLREAALEAAANAIIITDAEGHVQWMNPAFSSLSGYRFDELQGENPRLLKSGKQDPVVYQELWETIASGKVWRGELVNERKNGTLYHEEKTITPVRDPYGTITHYIAVSTDISERKWTEEALESLVESMVGVTGMAYLHQVTRSLCEWFQTDGACIGEMIDRERIRAVAMVLDGQLRDGYEYLLCGTPCAGVLSQGPLLIEQQAAALFPDDPQIAKLGIQGYAGVPLEDLGGQARGILWIISRAHMRLPGNWKGVLQIIAAKAAAEIARLHAEEALRSKSAYLDGILMSSFNMAVVATDVDYRVRIYNPAAERIMGLRADEVMGLTIKDIHEREHVDPRRFARGMDIVDREGQHRYTVEKSIGGEPHFIESRMSKIFHSDGTAIGYVLTAEDVTQRRRDADLLERQANFDSLTELPNRRLLMERLNQAIAHCRRHQRLGAVLFLDLDHFKDFNDSLGHLLGDKLLQVLAERLGRRTRQEDVVARLGGDEFVVLLRDIGGSEAEANLSAQLSVQKIMDLVSAPCDVEGHRIHITTSVGIALFPTHGADAHAIIKSADTAMYQAKAKGRNTYRFFSVEMQEMAERRFRRQSSLREAIENNQLCLHYQAQVDSRGYAVGVEALLRWNHPERGLIGPAELIRTAEETGQIVPIGEWVLRLALGELYRWKQRAPDLALRSVSVNVSPIQFRQRDFVERAEAVILGSGLTPDHLVLELTENVLLEDFDQTVDKILRLKRLGVRFSLDDFGTGYSSLSYLRHLPVEVIKIDKSFIADICDDPQDAKLVETILSLAETLGKVVIAEGVETQAQRDLLLGWGCRLFQGYLFHRPQGCEDLLVWLTEHGLPLNDA